jgi:hypothetical protein
MIKSRMVSPVNVTRVDNKSNMISPNRSVNSITRLIIARNKRMPYALTVK